MRRIVMLGMAVIIVGCSGPQDRPPEGLGRLELQFSDVPECPVVSDGLCLTTVTEFEFSSDVARVQFATGSGGSWAVDLAPGVYHLRPIDSEHCAHPTMFRINADAIHRSSIVWPAACEVFDDDGFPGEPPDSH